MRQISANHLTTLLAVHEPTRISLCMPTYWFHPDNQQDPIYFPDLLQETEECLSVGILGLFGRDRRLVRRPEDLFELRGIPVVLDSHVARLDRFRLYREPP